MDTFTTAHLAKIFDLTEQTIKSWSAEFASDLSPMATPPAGKRRRFTRADVEVFALVSDYRNKSVSFEEIHLALNTNQRGEVPPIADELAVQDTTTIIMTLKNQMASLQFHITELQSDRSEAEGQVKLLKDQLDAKERLIRQLYEENAELRVKVKSNSTQ